MLIIGSGTIVPHLRATDRGTPDHYWPFLHALGAADAGQVPKHVFEAFHSRTLSMRCLQSG